MVLFEAYPWAGEYKPGNTCWLRASSSDSILFWISRYCFCAFWISAWIIFFGGWFVDSSSFVISYVGIPLRVLLVLRYGCWFSSALIMYGDSDFPLPFSFTLVSTICSLKWTIHFPSAGSKWLNHIYFWYYLENWTPLRTKRFHLQKELGSCMPLIKLYFPTSELGVQNFVTEYG